MSAWKGEFLGFTYDNVHSSTLGIVRTSDGSRFNENLLPTQQNRTVVVPGRDETYFFGSNSTQRQFDVSFAFDSITQDQLNQMRSLFGGKDVRDLKFDERENIIWKAKVTASSIKYIPFDSDSTGDLIYKGEGTIQFTCYQPYGVETKEVNLKQGQDTQEIIIVNDSPIPMDWSLQVIGDVVNFGIKDGDYVQINSAEALKYASTGDTTDIGFFAETYSGLIRGIYLGTKYQKSQKIYNQFITSGKISKIPPNSAITFFVNWNSQNNQTATLTYKKYHQ